MVKESPGNKNSLMTAGQSRSAAGFAGQAGFKIGAMPPTMPVGSKIGLLTD